MCGCCDVCAKGEGDNCGGLYHFHGKCGDNLVCVNRRPNTVKVLGENDYIPGTCEPSKQQHSIAQHIIQHIKPDTIISNTTSSNNTAHVPTTFFLFHPGACGVKKCGFNQRCQLNQRGKARCVCPRYCKRRYMPVCGLTNGRHYWNRCFLRKDECKAQQRIGYVDGSCKSEYYHNVYYRFGKYC